MIITILENRIDDIITLLGQIPELDAALPGKEDIQSRIKDRPNSVLTAYVADQPVGFKIGYEREGHFYSWLGGVLPKYRQQGVAGILATYQEDWARKKGYSRIWMKTRNRFPEMLMMAYRRGFYAVRMELREDLAEHRIVLEKSL